MAASKWKDHTANGGPSLKRKSHQQWESVPPGNNAYDEKATRDKWQATLRMPMTGTSLANEMNPGSARALRRRNTVDVREAAGKNSSNVYPQSPGHGRLGIVGDVQRRFAHLAPPFRGNDRDPDDGMCNRGFKAPAGADQTLRHAEAGPAEWEQPLRAIKGEANGIHFSAPYSRC
uniref:Uncharacterized protein n=1 Tax=Trichuris muris TaxID=70415 RepID=A0A5S6Q057_TRIMR